MLYYNLKYILPIKNVSIEPKNALIESENALIESENALIAF